MRDRVDVPAGTRVALEDLDVVSARQEVGSASPEIPAPTIAMRINLEVELTFAAA